MRINFLKKTPDAPETRALPAFAGISHHDRKEVGVMAVVLGNKVGGSPGAIPEENERLDQHCRGVCLRVRRDRSHNISSQTIERAVREFRKWCSHRRVIGSDGCNNAGILACVISRWISDSGTNRLDPSLAEPNFP